MSRIRESAGNADAHEMALLSRAARAIHHTLIKRD
jgi:hypothetical protein